jgi:hypothetical protein
MRRDTYKKISARGQMNGRHGNRRRFRNLKLNKETPTKEESDPHLLDRISLERRNIRQPQKLETERGSMNLD